MTIFAFTRHTGVRIAEIGFALIVIAGFLQAVAPVGSRVGRRTASAGGVSLAAGAILILIAIRWGSYGSFF